MAPAIAWDRHAPPRARALFQHVVEHAPLKGLRADPYSPTLFINGLPFDAAEIIAYALLSGGTCEASRRERARFLLERACEALEPNRSGDGPHIHVAGRPYNAMEVVGLVWIFVDEGLV